MKYMYVALLDFVIRRYITMLADNMTPVGSWHVFDPLYMKEDPSPAPGQSSGTHRWSAD